MRLSPILSQQLEEVRRTEPCAMIENLLRVRFGSLDEELSEIISHLLLLSPEEFTPLLLQLSREELIARFARTH